MKSLNFLFIATTVFGLFGVCGAFENPANTKNFLSSINPKKESSYRAVSLSFGSSLSRADSPDTEALFQDISFKHIGIEDGLPENQTFDILQDRQGFIWIATRGGISRFDGMDFVTYKHRDGDESSLSSNYAWGLIEDREGFIWVGTAIGGLSRFDQRSGTFTSFTNPDSLQNGDSPVSNSVWGMVEDPGGGIWIGIIGKGLEFRNPDTGEVKVIRLDPAGTDALGRNSPTTLKFDKSGRFWVGTYGSGLELLDPETGDSTTFRNDPDDPNSLVNDFIWVIEEDSQGFLWIGTDNGLSRFEPSTGTFKNYQENSPEGFSATQVTSVHEDENGYIWFGSRSSGINIYNPRTNRFQSITSKDGAPGSLSSNSVFKIIQDDQNGYWIATENGVDYYSPKQEQFGHAHGGASDQDHGLTEKHVLAFHEDPSGNIWIGTGGGGLNLYNPNNDNFESFRHDPNDPTTLSTNVIVDIAGDSKGILWIGTSGGLNAFSPGDGTVIRYVDDPGNDNSLNTKNIFSVAVDNRDRVWIATYGEGVNRLDPASGEVKKFRNDLRDVNSLSLDLAGDVMVDRLGRAWVATEFGLNKIDPETDAVTRFFHKKNDPKSLSSSLVNAAYEDSKGRIWVATDDGVNLFEEETETFRRFSFGDELPSNLIYDVVEDDLNYIWLSTANGLVRFDPASNKAPRVYDYRDGLQNSKFGRNSAMKTRDGSLYFGGKNGFNKILPDRIMSNTFKPPVFITDIRLFNESINIGNDSPLTNRAGYATKVTFGPDHSVFSFEFAALDYNAPSKILYKYILEGFDRDWVRTDSRHRFATYTNLDPGKYKFKVRATNSGGIWSDKEASISVVVLPPWYATLWFRAGIVGLVILTILFWYRSWGQVTQGEKHVERILQLAAIIPTVFIIAVVWEFVFEGANFPFSSFNLHSEIVSEKWEYVFTVTFAATIALVVPIFLIIKSDIARREIEVQLQEAVASAEKANKAKSTFLANISHEIRTPLTGLLGTTYLLGKTPLNEKQRDLLETARSTGGVLLGLLNDILDVSRIESGRLSLKHVPFDLKTLIEQAGQSLRGNARRKRLELIVDIANLPERVYGDPTRIQQIMFNLLSNAVKFTEQGQITLTVSCENEVDWNSGNDNLVSICFTITDTGIGIAAQNIGKLFSPFTQEDDSTERLYGGSGLGLSICKSLIEAMGGEIGVDSTQGEGSTFWFVLDLELCRDFSDVPSNTSTLTPPALSILLVDDVSETRQIVSMMLEEKGHRVALADSGHAAIEAVLRDRFDLILMDIHMPEMGGVAATQAIRRLPESEGGKTPVFAFTADVVKDALEAYKASGMEAVVAKPLRMDEFNKTLMDHFCPNGARSSVKTDPRPAISVKPRREDDNLLELSSIDEYQRMMSEEELRELLSRYRTNNQQMVEKILSGKKRGDMASVASNAHKLAGAAGSIGCAALKTQARHVQKIAESGNSETLENALSRLMEIQNKSLLALDAVIGDRITST